MPSDMTIRPMTTIDIPAGLHLCRAANWNQLAEDWTVFLQPPSQSFIAEKHDRVVGSVAGLRYDDYGWIAMMLVDPAERGAGIGAKLMEQVLDALTSASVVGLDATPLGEPLYRKFGFNAHFTLARTKCTIDSARFPAPQSVRPMQFSDLPAVFARDREVFGHDRSALLASLHQRAPESAWISDAGYCFGRPGHLYRQIGPVVADTVEAARDLVSACASRLHGQVCCLDASRLDPDWLCWLAKVGFVEERPFIRMFLGDHAHPGIPDRQYAITGPEFA